jgi:hypothetical protein
MVPTVPLPPAMPSTVQVSAPADTVAVNCCVCDSVRAANLGKRVTLTEPLTDTVALTAALVPPAPEQVNVYVVGVVRAAVALVPLGDNVPLQPPLAVQEVALVELQVSVEAVPRATAVGFALREAVGVRLTVAVAGVLVPPAPVQVSE